MHDLRKKVERKTKLILRFWYTQGRKGQNLFCFNKFLADDLILDCYSYNSNLLLLVGFNTSLHTYIIAHPNSSVSITA